MRKLSFVAWMAMISFFAIPLQAQQSFSGDTWAQVKAKGSGTIVITYVETPAFAYHDENGELQGICMDIMNDFLRFVKNSYKVDINTVYKGEGNNFKTFYESVKNSKEGVFGLGNVTITDARKNEVAFSPAYIKSFAVLVSKNDVPDVSDASELKKVLNGFTAYVPKGTTHEQRMLQIKQKDVPNLKIEYTSSSFEAFDKMLADKNAVCFQDIAIYWDYKQKGNPVKIVNYETDKGEELGLIMPLNSDWAPLFNDFFSVGSGYKSSAFYRNSLIKHLGTEVVQMLKMVK